MTGRVLAIEGGDHGFGLGALIRPAPFGWDIGPGDMIVQAGSKSSVVKDAAVERCAPRGDPKRGTELFLRFHKVTLRCQFDPKTGLLSTVRDGIVSFGRPSAPLLAAIKKLFAAK